MSQCPNSPRLPAVSSHDNLPSEEAEERLLSPSHTSRIENFIKDVGYFAYIYRLDGSTESVSAIKRLVETAVPCSQLYWICITCLILSTGQS